MEIKDRLRIIIKELFDNSNTLLANELGIKPQSLTPYLNGKQKLGVKMLNKIVALGVNKEWLLTGKGTIKSTLNRNNYQKQDEMDIFIFKQDYDKVIRYYTGIDEEEPEILTYINPENYKSSDIQKYDIIYAVAKRNGDFESTDVATTNDIIIIKPINIRDYISNNKIDNKINNKFFLLYENLSHLGKPNIYKNNFLLKIGFKEPLSDNKLWFIDYREFISQELEHPDIYSAQDKNNDEMIVGIVLSVIKKYP